MADIDVLIPVRQALSNGMRVMALHMPNTHRQVLQAQVLVGSRFEPQEQNGISHFLEHMLYRGTASFPSAHAQSLAFERWGGTLMASTATDTGELSIAVPPENFAHVLGPFAEVFTRPLLGEIEVERGIVTEEILETLDDRGACVDPNDLIRGLVFDGHPLGMPITGTLDHLNRFDEAMLRRHHRDFYTANGTIVVTAGPLDPELVLREIEQAFVHVEAGSVPRSQPPPVQEQRRFKYVPHSSSQTQLRIAFRGPACGDAGEPAVQVMMRLLDDGMATRLYHRVCDQKGLCYDVSAGFESYADAGLIELSAETGHERIPAVLAELLAIVDELRSTLAPEEELTRVKQRYRWQLDYLLDDVAESAEYFALEAQSGTERTLAQRLEQIQSVTAGAVRDAATRWLKPENLSVIAVGMLNKNHLKRVNEQLERFG